MHETISYGTPVKVIRQSKYRNTKLIGEIGIAKSSYNGGSIPVEFAHHVNPASSYGYYYFKYGELEIVKEENIMEETTMNTITNYFNLAKIQFLSESTPSDFYYANFDTSLVVGDTCVAKYPNTRNVESFGVAKVVAILDQQDIETSREIVSKVDMKPYEERVAARARAAELKTKMQERAKKLQDIALYQMLAKEDPEMAELLRNYQSLGL